jgi:hypothetical protein
VQKKYLFSVAKSGVKNHISALASPPAITQPLPHAIIAKSLKNM